MGTDVQCPIYVLDLWLLAHSIMFGKTHIIMFGRKLFEDSVRNDTLQFVWKDNKDAPSKMISTNYLVPKKEG